MIIYEKVAVANERSNLITQYFTSDHNSENAQPSIDWQNNLHQHDWMCGYSLTGDFNILFLSADDLKVHKVRQKSSAIKRS